MIIQRPGNIGNYESFTPKKAFSGYSSSVSALGDFGKGFYAPPPAAAPAAPAQIRVVERAVVQAQQAPGGVDAATRAEINELKRIVRELKRGREIIPADARKVIPGSGGKTVKELLTSPGQTKFTRTTDKPGRLLGRRDYRRLGPMPPGFDEARYLRIHPDIANAVRKKIMPSGLWHYKMYGKKEGRSLSGYRRPGFLAGIFANWNWRY